MYKNKLKPGDLDKFAASDIHEMEMLAAVRRKEMLDMYYNDDMSLAEIAQSFDISRQGVRSVLKKGETILTEMEQKLNLASRFVTVQEKSSEIASRLSKINSEINDSFVSNEINLVIKQIKELADYTD